MAINVYPTNSAGFSLRHTITSTRNIDLGQPRRAFVILAGGGGSGGINAGTSGGGGGGGGAAGVVAGTMMASWLGLQIGAGGAAVVSTGSSGNDGNASYLVSPANYHQVSSTTESNQINLLYIVACGGQKGFNATTSQGAGNLSFDQAANPTISGVASYQKAFGCSGSMGGGGIGNASTAILNGQKNISSADALVLLNGWDHNIPTYYNNNSLSDAGALNYINIFSDPSIQPATFLSSDSGITSYTGARSRWTTNTGTSTLVPAGRGGGAGAAGYSGSSGMFAGSGAGGSGYGQTQSPPGGGGRFYSGGNGGSGGNGQGAPGAGGGAGVAAPGSNGSLNSGQRGGNGGDGGLGGGGGGGAGGNELVTSTNRTSGKGGDGVCLIFY